MIRPRLEEVRYYFILARDLEYLPRDVKWAEVDEIARALGAYVRTLLKPNGRS
jgi:hypothetical protein